MNKHIFHFAIITSFFTSFSSMNTQNNTFWLRGHVHDHFTDTEIKEAKVCNNSKMSNNNHLWFEKQLPKEEELCCRRHHGTIPVD